MKKSQLGQLTWFVDMDLAGCNARSAYKNGIKCEKNHTQMMCMGGESNCGLWGCQSNTLTTKTTAPQDLFLLISIAYLGDFHVMSDTCLALGRY